MPELPEMIDGWPNICGQADQVRAYRAANAGPVHPAGGAAARARAGWAIALHLHQPQIPAGGGDIRTAEIISNLKHMFDNPGTGDNHNAGVFLWCYKRIGEFVPELVDAGAQPRVMLDYSGNLFHGLRHMGQGEVFDTLRRVTCEPRYRHCVEWLGTAWGHAVAPSTPPADFRRHVLAWQQHFAGIFGLEALARVRGFSPSEMALPADPDVAFAYVQTLREAGFRWLLVQEHTIEDPQTGNSPSQPYVPHRLVCRNRLGEAAEILCLVKTQGSDTKLVAQMQPCYEARSKGPATLPGGRQVPPCAVQIGDGENGGVMMNEFPGMFRQAMRESSGSEAPPMTGTEYLEALAALGVKDEEYPVVQPKWQKLLFEHQAPGPGVTPEAMKAAQAKAKAVDGRFHMDGGSWTDNISWVSGYDDLLGPMERLSALFAAKTKGAATQEPRFRKALFHLLCSQTSCYRYWGQGIWVEYGKEICRRAEEILKHDF
jgi:hypothetical protein